MESPDARKGRRRKAAVAKAKERRVCRICGGPDSPRTVPGKVDAFVYYRFGREYAHQVCIENEDAGLYSTESCSRRLLEAAHEIEILEGNDRRW